MTGHLPVVDGGLTFGTWTDSTSRLLYHDVMPVLLNGVDTSGSVVDLGGGNGLLRTFVPHAVTVDIDASKAPDIVADATTYTGRHDLVVIRYVLHYMPNDVVDGWLTQLRTWHTGPVLVIQFVNDDLAGKLANSVNERKWFRTELDYVHAFERTGWRVASRKRVEYRVEAEFYRNRLAHPSPTAHEEAVMGWLLKVPQ